MSDEQAQGGLRMAHQRRSDGGMAMEIDIGSHRIGELGTRRFGLGRLAPLGPQHFGSAEIAFVENHLAIVPDIGIDAPALALGGLLILP